MSKNDNKKNIPENEEQPDANSKFKSLLNQPEDELHKMLHLPGMYQNWFLDYASYVILERAVPHIQDGLKPVQRRILHSMKKMDDGRYNKVANIIGHTMQYHPHGDASIQEALVQLGQKDLLIDRQGNWGNIYTGDDAAAARYIEARLTKFAQEILFNPKTTNWKNTYDGRNQEPIVLPAKFPLLLFQGVEGIAVGLASKILPHNFNELIDAAIAHLRKKSFILYPDFSTGGMIDVSKYNDGQRGGSVKIRAKINIVDKNTLVITELPFGKTTGTLIDSILKATEKGKIKIKKIDDNTAENVEIQIQLVPGTSPDVTIDALYAFTDCETPVSPNACVVDDDKPKFIGVSDILKRSVENTVSLLTKELEIKKSELEEDWHMSSLEKIFIEKKIYLSIEECKTWEEIIETIDDGLKPYKKKFIRAITQEDIEKLTEIKIRKISKFDKKKADETIKGIENEIEQVKEKLANIIPYAIEYFINIKKKYGVGKERKTEIRNFESIQATEVIANNCKLYVNREEGFIGSELKKDEFVCDCSDIDDIIVFLSDGTFKITKMTDKVFVGKDIIHIAVFKKNDERTIYNVIYRDGLNGNIMVKRSSVTGLTRDKEYTITKGTKGSKIIYFTANPNGEAEKLKISLKPRPKLKKLSFEFDFANLEIRGRNSLGNILSRYALHKIELLKKGESTLGGQKIWYDETVMRLNTDIRGKYLGEFHDNDKILVISNAGWYRITNFDLTNHYDEDDILLIEKFNPKREFTIVFYDADDKFNYLKRFTLENTSLKQSLIGDNENSKLILLSTEKHPRIKITYTGDKDNEIVDAFKFIAIKGFKAHGKRLTTAKVKKIEEIDPLIKEDNAEPEENLPFENNGNGKSGKDAKQITLNF